MFLGGRDAFLEKYPTLEKVNQFSEESAAFFRKSTDDICENMGLIAKDFISAEAGEKLDAYKDRLWEEFDIGFFEPYGDFQTIIHGDSWANNAMYLYQEGDPQEISLVDFQCIRMSSPAVDLVYLIITGKYSREKKSRKENILLCFETF